MRYEMAMTQNVRRFLAAVRELNDRPMGVEGMAILWGEPGEGKSTTVAYACNTLDGLFLRANACWTPTSMLAALMVELGRPSVGRRAPMVESAVKVLSEQPRPIFIDEADYLFAKPGMLDIMRDLYDITGSPVILIGMEEFARKVQVRGKFARRITQWVEFSGIDLEDTRELAATVCEIAIDEDLIKYLHKAARCNIGRMITAMARIEQFGKINGFDPAGGKKAVTRRDWGNRSLFYDQPRFAKRRS
jgi:DNA transposition AAA+ family ATPase